MKKACKVLVLALAVIAAGGLVFANGGSDASKSKSNKYALIVKNTGNPYNEKEAAGFEAAVKEFGGIAIVKRPANPTAEDQIAMINELISQGVASIAIAANDFDALQPACQKAAQRGIKVISLDSSLNPASRLTHVQQADPVAIGVSLVEAAYDLSGGKGDIAILSATSTATNQNTWIENMKKTLAEPKYKDLKLVKVAYGDDLRDKSVSETEALLQTYPNLKVIVAPTTVGIAAAAKVVTDKGLIGKVAVTGLGLPSEMAAYMTKNGSCPYMYLWNPIDIGYLAGYTAKAMVEGKSTGKVGDSFVAGRLGKKSVVTATSNDGGTEVVLGGPFKFDTANIGEWKSVY
jgi:rhamnose transport system substrate-binding protein